MRITDFATQRRTTKAFDPSRKLSDEQIAEVQTLLQYAPSSTNSQPWHFIIASTDEGKNALRNPPTQAIPTIHRKSPMPRT